MFRELWAVRAGTASAPGRGPRPRVPAQAPLALTFRRRHQNDLLGPRRRRLFEQTSEAGRPIDQPVGLPPPVSVGRKPDQGRLRGVGHAQGTAQHIDQVVACEPREIERVGPPRAGDAGWRKQRAPKRLAHQPEDQIPPRVEVVHDQ